ncbi:hypothetical protein DFH28DRAFT_885416 [Melampsora americana]|nr:hypothetical protein DFH28DRAFT_885416 [Melampsora americana]
MHYLMDAFCHCTYQESKGHCFVTNQHGSGSVVANPQIHDINPENVWGSRNGQAVAVAFMTDQHKCQLGCQILQLPKLIQIPVQPPHVDLIWQHRQKLPNGEKITHGHVDIPTSLYASAGPLANTSPAPLRCRFNLIHILVCLYLHLSLYI